MGTGGSFPQGEVDLSPPSNAEVKNVWSCTFIPPYVFMAWYLVQKVKVKVKLSLCFIFN